MVLQFGFSGAAEEKWKKTKVSSSLICLEMYIKIYVCLYVYVPYFLFICDTCEFLLIP
jgi:hypothetical protein